MKIQLNCDLPTLNKYINAERSNKFMASKMKKNVESCLILELKRLKFKLPVQKMFDINFVWIRKNNRSDHDNISFSKKFILDSFVKSGILENDNPKYIRNFTDKFEIGKENYVIVEFEIVD